MAPDVTRPICFSAVGRGVGLRKPGGLLAEPVRLVGEGACVLQTARGEPGGHARERGGEGHGYGGGCATAGGRFSGRREFQEPAQRFLQVTRTGGLFTHARPTISPRSSMSMRVAAGTGLRPGMVRTSPQIT